MKAIKLPSPSFVLACLALFAAVAGGAYAAGKIKGSSIKRGTITGKQVKKDTLTGKKIQEGTLAEVPSAANAANAVQLDSVPASGFHRYGSSIPSGQTVTGLLDISVDEVASANGMSISDAASLPVAAPSPITNADILFGPGAGGPPVDPACTGSADNPTAPNGKACLYPIAVGTNTQVLPSQFPAGNRLGFSIRLSDADGDPNFIANWAYTAP